MESTKTQKHNAKASCNTKEEAPAKAVRSCKFFVTFWQKCEFLWDESIMKYACMCDDHCSEEHDGKWHGHYYVYYKNARTWKQLKKYFGDEAHIEIPHSNSGAINYIMGRGEHANSKSNMIERGTMPCDNGQHISVQRALSMTNDELKELDDHKDVISIMKVRNLMDDGVDLDNWNKDIKVTFITGDSGAGKSTLAKTILKQEGFKKAHIIKFEQTFYHGVGNGYGAAIYDDFRDSHMKPSEFINLIDYNRHYMNIKGGSILNNYNRIIITSVQNPNDLYSGINDDEPRKQWLRRMEVINLNDDGCDL